MGSEKKRGMPDEMRNDSPFSSNSAARTSSHSENGERVERRTFADVVRGDVRALKKEMEERSATLLAEGSFAAIAKGIKESVKRVTLLRRSGKGKWLVVFDNKEAKEDALKKKVKIGEDEAVWSRTQCIAVFVEPEVPIIPLKDLIRVFQSAIGRVKRAERIKFSGFWNGSWLFWTEEEVNFREKKFTIEDIKFKVENRQYRNMSAEVNESEQNPEIIVEMATEETESEDRSPSQRNSDERRTTQRTPIGRSSPTQRHSDRGTERSEERRPVQKSSVAQSNSMSGTQISSEEIGSSHTDTIDRLSQSQNSEDRRESEERSSSRNNSIQGSTSQNCSGKESTQDRSNSQDEETREKTESTLEKNTASSSSPKASTSLRRSKRKNRKISSSDQESEDRSSKRVYSCVTSQ